MIYVCLDGLRLVDGELHFFMQDERGAHICFHMWREGLIALFSCQDPTLSWTDDLPVCHQSGVGFATNQIYREDGFRREEHDFEDRSIHFR